MTRTHDTNHDWYAKYRREVERNKRERDKWEAGYRAIMGANPPPEIVPCFFPKPGER